MKGGEGAVSYERRGSFNHAHMAKQLLRFDNIAYYGNATPMDIDGLIEWHDKKRVLLEIKRKGVLLLDGERLAYKRLIDDFQLAGKESICIVADHEVFNYREDVDVASCIVREIYHSKEKKWRPTKRMMTVKMLLDSFLLPL